jgi:hypothetical protein
MRRGLIPALAAVAALLSLCSAALGGSKAPARATTPPAAGAPLVHTWSNVDWLTPGLARLKIFVDGSGNLRVHALGSCSPSPCDWGEVTGHVFGSGPGSATGTSFTAHFDVGGIQVDLAGIVSGTSLTVHEFSTYPDGRSDSYRLDRFGIAFNDVRWGSRARIPSPHVEAAGAVVGTKLYVISGGMDDCTDGLAAPASAKTNVYDAATNTWSNAGLVNVPRDNSPVAAAIGGKIYLIGGSTGCGTGVTVRTVEALDLGTNAWSALPPASDLPASLDGLYHCGAAVGSKIYYFEAAGIGVFNTATGTWSVLPADPLLNPSWHCKAVVTNAGKILITGAGNGSADANSRRELLFDPATGTIVHPPAVTTTLAEHAMGFIGVQALVAGGDFGSPAEQGAQILGAGNWVADTSPLPQTSDDAVSGVIGGKLFIAGGVGSAHNLTPAVLVGIPS